MAFGSDAIQITAILKGLTALSERVVKKITLDVTANLIEATPIDLGWARANWVPAIGKPYEVEVGSNADKKGTAGARAKQESGIASVATGYKLIRGSVFISNNVPYILRLNGGSSNQEPAGFVQRAIAKAVANDFVGL